MAENKKETKIRVVKVEMLYPSGISKAATSRYKESKPNFAVSVSASSGYREYLRSYIVSAKTKDEAERIAASRIKGVWKQQMSEKIAADERKNPSPRPTAQAAQAQPSAQPKMQKSDIDFITSSLSKKQPASTPQARPANPPPHPARPQSKPIRPQAQPVSKPSDKIEQSDIEFITSSISKGEAARLNQQRMANYRATQKAMAKQPGYKPDVPPAKIVSKKSDLAQMMSAAYQQSRAEHGLRIAPQHMKKTEITQKPSKTVTAKQFDKPDARQLMNKKISDKLARMAKQNKEGKPPVEHLTAYEKTYIRRVASEQVILKNMRAASAPQQLLSTRRAYSQEEIDQMRQHQIVPKGYREVTVPVREMTKEEVKRAEARRIKHTDIQARQEQQKIEKQLREAEEAKQRKQQAKEEAKAVETKVEREARLRRMQEYKQAQETKPARKITIEKLKHAIKVRRQETGYKIKQQKVIETAEEFAAARPGYQARKTAFQQRARDFLGTENEKKRLVESATPSSIKGKAVQKRLLEDDDMPIEDEREMTSDEDLPTGKRETPKADFRQYSPEVVSQVGRAKSPGEPGYDEWRADYERYVSEAGPAQTQSRLQKTGYKAWESERTQGTVTEQMFIAKTDKYGNIKYDDKGNPIYNSETIYGQSSEEVAIRRETLYAPVGTTESGNPIYRRKVGVAHRRDMSTPTKGGMSTGANKQLVIHAFVRTETGASYYEYGFSSAAPGTNEEKKEQAQISLGKRMNQLHDVGSKQYEIDWEQTDMYFQDLYY